MKSFLKKNKLLYNVANLLYKYYYIKTRKLTNVMFYVTTRCNSRCQYCHIWQKKPKENLSVTAIKKVLSSKYITSRTTFGLEGGEFFLHPEYNEILDLFKGKNYTVLTNGLLPDTVKKAVTNHKIPCVQISLDGNKETYIRLRGVNAYNSILSLIDDLKQKTKIKIAFTFGPNNSYSDFEHVKHLCKEKRIEFLYENVYANMFYMDTNISLAELKHLNTFSEPVLSGFNEWLRGKLFLPCWSINTKVVIWANGDVPMCQYKDIVLGNIYTETFDGIWGSENTKELQEKHRNCNSCWVTYHRGFDINYLTSLSYVNKYIPSFRTNPNTCSKNK